eukprot:scaffold6247_cov104-Cylindrotheca_fusiformis.AAC.4
MDDRNNKRKRSEMGEVDPEYFVYTNRRDMKDTTDIPNDDKKRTFTHLRVDSSVREIPVRAFFGCNELVHVVLPETLTRINESAFEDCPKLKCVQFVSAETLSINDNLEDGMMVFPERTSRLHVDECAFSDCPSLRNVIVCSVSTQLGEGVFCHCLGLISAELPEGLQVIEPRLFYNCRSLTTVKIPSSVIKIDDGAFEECSSLTSFRLPHGLLEIGESSFRECEAIETLHIPNTVSKIVGGAFQDCSGLRQVQLPTTLERIEHYTFWGCSKLEYIEMPSTVTFVGRSAFATCDFLSHIRIPPSVDRMMEGALADCHNLISIELPERFLLSVTRDREFVAAIRNCSSLVNLAIPPLTEDLSNMGQLGPDSKFGSAVESEANLLQKLKHRFDNSPLNQLCYYHSYNSSEDAMVQLRSLMEDDPLAATNQVDEFGMTPLHILSLSQTPNVDMLLAVMKGGQLDHIIRGKDLFGSTPMDYLCLNRMPNSSEVIRRILQTRFACLLGLDRSWKSDVLQAVDSALAVDWSSRGREIIAIYLKLAKYERKEICSIVELYLWKVKIDEIRSKNEEVADRQSCRINSGASIAIPCVLPFLDNLDMEDYFGRSL